MPKFSSDLLWGLTRNNNSFLFKRRNVKTNLTTDPLNLTGRVHKADSGLCNPTAVGISVENVKGKSRQKDNKGKASTRRVAKLVLKGKKGVSRSAVTSGSAHLISAIKSLKGVSAVQRAQALRKAVKIHQMRN